VGFDREPAALYINKFGFRNVEMKEKLRTPSMRPGPCVRRKAKGTWLRLILQAALPLALSLIESE
jgi:hypothetical protein